MYTNMYIMRTSENFERSRDATVTDRVEMNAFIGLLLFAETYRASHLHFKDLWDQDGPEIFSVMMSYERFLSYFAASYLTISIIEMPGRNWTNWLQFVKF